MRRSFLTITLPLVAWTVLMLAVSSVPGIALPAPPVWNWDKLAHFAEYAVFAVLLHRYLLLRRREPPATALRLCILWGIALGAYDELHQFLIPLRDATLLDLVADTVGVLLGTAIAVRLSRRTGAS